LKESGAIKSIFIIAYHKIKAWFKKKWNKYKYGIVITTLILLFLIIYFWKNIFISIHPGYKGVLWHRFGGTVLTRVYGEGVHAILPIDRMILYDIKRQNIDDSISILTSEGLYIDLQYSFRFHPIADSVAVIHQSIGSDYLAKIVLPEVRGAALSVIGNYTPEKLYKMSTLFIQASIRHHLLKQLSPYNIIIEDIIITKITLPETIKASIERKLAAEQLSMEFDYKLMIEEKERQRKAIEASGIREFETVSGISILKWKGLEVTSELAKSENAKIIIMGNGDQDLPILLNTESKP